MATQHSPSERPATEVVISTLKAQEMQAILRAQLPKEVPLDRFTEATAAAMRARPEIFECDKNSLYNAIVEAARKGVLPDGKQGALAPFNTNIAPKGQKENWIKRVQFMIMPEGIIAAFAKVGITAYAQSVFESDDFNFWSDDAGQHVAHKFDPFQNRGTRIGAYACGRTRGGVVYVEAMGMEDLAKVRKRSKSPDRGPWVEFTDRMEQKSALHRLDKRMPGAGVLGDEDGEPEKFVATVDAAAGGVGTQVTDETKRPRGLQAVIDSAEEGQYVEGAGISTHDGEVF